jgi:hypothetical protein
MNRFKSCAIFFCASLSACVVVSKNQAETNNPPPLQHSQFIGFWAAGKISVGKGSYFEESFKDDGAYCALFFDVDGSELSISTGSWTLEDNLLTITARKLKDGSSDEESREIMKVSAAEISFRFAPLPEKFVMRRLPSTKAHRWCRP